MRLLVLTGSGGVGKTRLALRLAANVLPDFEDGVVFVPLAALSDPNLVLPTIARSVGIQESGNATVADLLKSYLQGKKLLLVLDNFEHLLGASVSLEVLLTDLPDLKLLVTSRVLLHIYGEYEYIVPPLRLPEPALHNEASITPGLSLTQLAAYDAIALFVQRAQAAKPGFCLTDENWQEIVEICQRLDGLPLAIELAAVRIKTLTPAFILARLDHRLTLLNRGPQTLPVRQQTLRGLLDWSYDLLNDEERQLLICLSVFVGGCSLEAVAQVCGSDSRELPTAANTVDGVLDKLSNLIDKSILQMAPAENGEPRFFMLETLREYALEKCQASGQMSYLRQRHATYFLHLAQQAETALGSADQKIWLDRLEIEHDNFRSALSWAIEEASVSGVGATSPDEQLSVSNLALRLSSLLAWFWDLHCHLSEGRRWLALALDQTEEPGPDQLGEISPPTITNILELQLRAKALNSAGNLAHKQSDNTQATLLLEGALKLRRILAQPREIALTLNNLGVVAYHQGDIVGAQKFYEESLAIKQTLGDKRTIALSLNNLAELHRANQQAEKAITLFEESLALLREAGDIHNTALVLLNLGVTTGDLGSYSWAAQLLTESLSLLGEVKDIAGVAETLDRLAGLITQVAELPIAARLFGAAHRLRQTIKTTMSETYQARYEQSVQFAQSNLESEVWTAQWASGQQMTLEEIIEYVLNQFPLIQSHVSNNSPDDLKLASLPATSPTSIEAIVNLPDGLTPREMEVLKLAATGLTTAQIAQILFLSPLTISAHLRSIYAKLNITSRSAATLYAIQNKLI